MDDVLKIFGFITALSMGGTIAYALVGLTRAFLRRLERGESSPAERVELELAELRARLDESDQLRTRVAELEERLDFTERMLARQREPNRLGSGEA